MHRFDALVCRLNAHTLPGTHIHLDYDGDDAANNSKCSSCACITSAAGGAHGNTCDGGQHGQPCVDACMHRHIDDACWRGTYIHVVLLVIRCMHAAICRRAAGSRCTCCWSLRFTSWQWDADKDAWSTNANISYMPLMNLRFISCVRVYIDI